jgi:hypothetical protein
MYEVTQGMPIPAPAVGLGPKEPKYPWKLLHIGDSFFVPLGDKKSPFNVYGPQQRYNFKLCVRTTTEDGIKGERVWRVA